MEMISYIPDLLALYRILGQVQQQSRLMRDQPMSPGDWATYWVEYVLNHQGASHLRSPAMQIPWFVSSHVSPCFKGLHILLILVLLERDIC